MRALPDLQADFAAAVLDQDARAVADLIVPDGLAPAARVRIYGNHVISSLTDVLQATYPVTCRLVDPRFFDFAADCYIRRHPPAGPCLFEYGATFPEFLATFSPCAEHPYLADIARLEWGMNAALHAEDAAPIAPAALATVPPDEVEQLILQLDPSATWMRSFWPVDLIWQANQLDADPEASVDLAAGGVYLEVRRRGISVTFRRLERAEFVFRSALAGGSALETAVNSAMREDPGLDVTSELRALLQEELLVGFTSERAKGDAR